MLTFRKDGNELGQLEMLGEGQQLVIEATHHTGARVSSPLTEMPLAKLPVLTPAQIDEIKAEIRTAAAVAPLPSPVIATVGAAE